MIGRAMLTVLLGAGLVVSTAAAGLYDGSQPVICSFMQSVECSEEECDTGDADDVVIADFVRIDFKKKKISILDEGRRDESTEIRTIEKLDDRVILQGIESGRGWSLSIDSDTGETVLAVSGQGTAFAVFGECTLP